MADTRAVSAGRVLLWLSFLLAGLWCARTVRVAVGRDVGEFVQYYTAGRAAGEGEPVASFYDDRSFRALTRSYGIDATNIYYPNPPTTAFLSVPLGELPFRESRLAWLGVSVAASLGSIALLARVVPLHGPALPLFATYSLLFQPLASNLVQGQAYAVLLGLQGLGLWALRRGRTGVAGLAMAVPLAGKLASPGVVLLAALPRYRKLALSALGGALALSAASAAALGIAPWAAFLGVGRRISGDPSLVVPAFQSLHGMVFRTLTRDAAWNPAGTWQAPLLAGALTVSSLLALVLLGLAMARREADPVRVLAWFLSLGILASPFAQDYTYTSALPLAALACGEVAAERRPSILLAWLAGLALLGAPFQLFVRLPADGLAAPLAYPRVWGTLVLLLLLARGTAQRTEEAPA